MIAYEFCRGSWEEHYRHFLDKGIIRIPCQSSVSALSKGARCTQRRRGQVQHIVPEVTIPPEVTPENVTTYIVDSGGEHALYANF